MRVPHVLVCLAKDKFHENVYRKGVKPLQKRMRLKFCSYLDDRPPGGFANAIRRSIQYSNIVVGITDGTNANVLYELGMAIGLGKPIIPIDRRPETLPAMVRQYNALVLEDGDFDPLEFSAELETMIELALTGHWIDERFKTHIKQLVSPSPSNGTPKAMEKEVIDGDYLGAGIKAYGSADFDSAIDLLEKARHQNGDGADPQAHFLLADSYFLKGESLEPGEGQKEAFRKMQIVAREGVSLFQGHKELEKTHGLACLKLGDLGTAERIFLELTKNHPRYQVGFYNLACVFAMQKMILPCVETLDQLFSQNREWSFLARLDPDFDGIWKDDLFQRVLYPAASADGF